jgi:5-methyltetrahydrofolate--homocysteine methyltransferase
MGGKISELMAEMKEKETLQEIKSELEAGKKPLDIIEELREGVTIIGDKFERSEVFLTELIMGGEIFKEAMKILKPEISKSDTKVEKLGIAVIGTVQGDLHDIGKNIFVSLMDASGFEVYDLGIDVPPEKFVEAIKNYNANIVGMSALLSAGLYVMKDTVKAIEDAGLRDKVKILIGGGIAGEEMTKQMINADGFTEYASVGVRLAKEMMGGS